MATDDADLSLVDGLVQLSFAVQSVLTAAAGSHDLTVAQLRLMGILRDRKPGMMELAHHLGLDKSSVSGLVDRAERRGLVTRTTSADDGRAVRVSSTAHGRRLTKRVEAEISAEIGELTGVLSGAERRRLAAIATQLVGGTQG